MFAQVEIGLSRIPPLWPLRHFVAVNPFLGLLDQPFEKASATLSRTMGVLPLQQPHEYLAAFRSGKITQADLSRAGDEFWPAHRLITALENAKGIASQAPLLTVADLLDEAQPHSHWTVFVVDEIAKWCGVSFDENQTTWNSPWRGGTLFKAWRQGAALDRNPEAFGLKNFRAFVKQLPIDPDQSIEHCLTLLGTPEERVTDFVHRQLATVAGWAGYAQYLVREDVMRGQPNSTLTEVLAIRLAYDAALWSAFIKATPLAEKWRQSLHRAFDPGLLPALTRWQLAYEWGYQSQLAKSLTLQPHTFPSERPRVQAVFCIDVRSEVFRRHLESQDTGIQTIGFAGFFGFPIAHTPVAGTTTSRSPVLLVPPVHSHEAVSESQTANANEQRSLAGAWKAFQNSAASCFSFVESVGLGFGAALATLTKVDTSKVAALPQLGSAVTLETRVALAEGALRNMGLTRNFAPLVIVCGHGSQSANNPYASSLDCGACGGHAGDVNARLAATTLNDDQVRLGLAAKGILIPADTRFVAALHNTTIDEVTLFDGDADVALPVHDVAFVKAALAASGSSARKERAPALGLGALQGASLDNAVRSRGVDMSQVRPEWALANNAALVAAPRSRTAQLKLDGRVFLHDYDASLDPEDKVLTLILCAPVVVASWISLQYYASRVAPDVYGSGNKVLHNVVSGLGVCEGNGGDLRVGLPLQSIHDGTNFVHEPRRLTVFIDAAHDRIGAVLAAQAGVRDLFDNGWIHLVALEGDKALKYDKGTWRPMF